MQTKIPKRADINKTKSVQLEEKYEKKKNKNIKQHNQQ